MDIRIVDGRLVKDAELKVNKTNGNKFMSFTLANNGFAKGAPTTTFFNVVSYNEHDIERVENFKKGTLVVVSGRPNEVMTVNDGKTYLNRNIMAYSVEKGTPNGNRENQTQQTVYRDVAPAPVTCESPKVQTPTVTAPKVEQPAFTAVMPQIPSSYQNPYSNDENDLPF